MRWCDLRPSDTIVFSSGPYVIVVVEVTKHRADTVFVYNAPQFSSLGRGEHPMGPEYNVV